MYRILEESGVHPSIWVKDSEAVWMEMPTHQGQHAGKYSHKHIYICMRENSQSPEDTFILS